MCPQRPPCRCLFESAALGGGRALPDQVHKHYPDGHCELEAVSQHSPGPVCNDETLTRMLVHPIHFDIQTGLVSPIAFADAVNIDLSVFREENASDSEIQLAIDEIRKTGASKIPKQERIVTLVMQAKAAKVRNCTFVDDNSRMCFVYDTATSDKPNHASVFTPERATKKGGREVRRALLNLFSENRISPDNYRTLIYEGTVD